MPRIFVDTSAWYALLDKTDSFHASATGYTERFQISPYCPEALHTSVTADAYLRRITPKERGSFKAIYDATSYHTTIKKSQKTQTSTSPSVNVSSSLITTKPSAYAIDVIRPDPLNVGYATSPASLTGR